MIGRRSLPWVLAACAAACALPIGWNIVPLVRGVHGVDVSRYQEPLDWKAAAAAGVRFAWIKASEGVTVRDVRFAEHAEGAAAAGVAWGPYHFWIECADPRAQAENLLAAVGDRQPTFAVALDLERYGENAAQGQCRPDMDGRTRPLPSPAENRRDIETFVALVSARLGAVVLYMVDGWLHGSNVSSWLGDAPWDGPTWIRSLVYRPLRAPTAWQLGLRRWGTATSACKKASEGMWDLFRVQSDASLSACGWIDWNVLPGGQDSFEQLRRGR